MTFSGKKKTHKKKVHKKQDAPTNAGGDDGAAGGSYISLLRKNF